ncbi:tyrosinase-like protein tyr-3-like 1 [Homarus americanus]|uniref:Tyrosinase-like protein tyr-3-like 1 n=1 Tax=Homarus americanus TaxID=6706 RepID=A0A8J5JTF8_HOMAM|nr:tyrosinase-like protein tyr-3-like 1 [Homarus americanus]
MIVLLSFWGFTEVKGQLGSPELQKPRRPVVKESVVRRRRSVQGSRSTSMMVIWTPFTRSWAWWAVSCVLVWVAVVTASTTPTSADRREECQHWAQLGECDNNPDFMAPHCPRSCNNCPADPTCMDMNDQCVAWSRRGQCESNPSYMLHHCPNVCNACRRGSSASPRMFWSVLPAIKNALINYGQAGSSPEHEIGGSLCSIFHEPVSWDDSERWRLESTPSFDSRIHKVRRLGRGLAYTTQREVTGGGGTGEPSHGGHEGSSQETNRLYHRRTKRTINKHSSGGRIQNQRRSHSSRSGGQNCNFIKKMFGKCGRQTSRRRKGRSGGRRMAGHSQRRHRNRQRTPSYGRQMMTQGHGKFKKIQQMMSLFQQQPQKSFSRQQASRRQKFRQPQRSYSYQTMSRQSKMHNQYQISRRPQTHHRRQSYGDQRRSSQKQGGFLSLLKTNMKSW